MDLYKKQAKLFKVLMHPVRLAILDILRDGEQCVCHMEAFLDLRQAYISQQLMVLRDANLVEDRRDGWNVFYHVTRPEIYAVIDAALPLLGVKKQSQSRKYILLPKDSGCSCPKCAPVVTNEEQLS
jgi:DNA-binding transcriptional ArsR family regulator